MTKLQELRKQHGYSYRKLESLTGIGKSTLEKAEKGMALLTDTQWEKLAEILGTTKEDLLEVT